MPQMGPLPWVLICSVMLCMILVLMACIYSRINKSLKIKSSMSLKKIYSWKW